MKFVVLSQLTDDGAETVKDKPQRIKEVNAELKNMGVEVLDQYAILGEYDFLNIVEAPDNKTLAKAMLQLAARGTIRTKSMPAIPIDEFIG